MQFFDLPSHVVRILSDLRCHSLIQAIGDHPVNVAVCGNNLEQPHMKGHFFELDQNAVRQTVCCPFDFVEMNVALFFAQADHAVALQGGEECPTAAMKMLEIVDAGIPGIEQDCSRLDLLMRDRVFKHLHEMLVLGLAILFRGIHPVVNRVELASTVGVNQIHHADPFDHPMLIAAPLSLDQLNVPRMLLVLHAVIYDQIRISAVLYPVAHQLPQLARLQLRSRQVVTDLVVADSFKMLSKVGARPVVWCADQVFHILSLVYHGLVASFYDRKRKS